MPRASAVVLYVEDEETDRFLMARAFSKSGQGLVLKTASDGRAAMDYLSGTGPFGDRDQHPLPAVVLLDLNLPEMHGFEVLEWIRNQPAHAELPVVIFSSSERAEDQERARGLGANDFVKKPGSGLRFQDVVKNLSERWVRARTVVSE